MVKQPILIGAPRVKPEGLLINLQNLFKTITSVKSAYIAQVFNPTEDEKPHLSIGLIIDEDLKNIASKLDEIVKDSVGEDEFVDVIDLNIGSLKDAFSKLAPFYSTTSEKSI